MVFHAVGNSREFFPRKKSLLNWPSILQSMLPLEKCRRIIGSYILVVQIQKFK